MLRIHLILIANPDPDPASAMEKMDPDPGHFFKIYWIFFSLIFILKFDEPFIRGNFFSLSFFKSSDLGVKKSFFTPWIRIRIQEAKILRIQRIWIRILITGFYWWIKKIFLSSQLGPLAISNTWNFSLLNAVQKSSY